MSEMVPENILHNLDVLHENLVHYNPVVARLIQMGEDLSFTKWPAKENGPLAIEGGLVIHSVEVAMRMMQLHRVLDPRMKLMPLYSVMLVGLYHDIGKCGVEKYAYFQQLPATEDGVLKVRWQETALARTQGHAGLGLSLFDRAGVPLSEEERGAIALHAGQQLHPDDAIPLATLLFFANKWQNWFVRERELSEYAERQGHTGRS